MDKRVIFAVAGAGKTTYIVDKLDLNRRFILITYTDNNIYNLRDKIVTRFGYIPNNITIFSYYTFLHSYCYKPFLSMKLRTKGIDFKTPPIFTMKKKRSDLAYYLSSQNRLYHNRIAKLLEVKEVIEDIKRRLEKYCDALFVDEVQDFGGEDFNFLMAISKANTQMLYVGDFFQYTYATSHNGATNKNLHNEYNAYKKRFDKAGLLVDTTTLSKSYRCSENLCEFIRQQIGIEIYSHIDTVSTIHSVGDQVMADQLHFCKNTVKLFWESHQKYDCYSSNWGLSKGLDHYKDVCVVLTKAADKALKEGNISTGSPITRNKLYVACTRARGNLFLSPESFFRKHKLN